MKQKSEVNVIWSDRPLGRVCITVASALIITWLAFLGSSFMTVKENSELGKAAYEQSKSTSEKINSFEDRLDYFYFEFKRKNYQDSTQFQIIIDKLKEIKP